MSVTATVNTSDLLEALADSGIHRLDIVENILPVLLKRKDYTYLYDLCDACTSGANTARDNKNQARLDAYECVLSYLHINYGVYTDPGPVLVAIKHKLRAKPA